MMVLVLDCRIGRHLHVRLRSDLNNIREEVPSLEGEVLDNKIELFVGIFDARNGDVANFLDNGRNDDATDVMPELRF